MGHHDTCMGLAEISRSKSGALAFIRRLMSVLSRSPRPDGREESNDSERLYGILADTSEDFIFLVDRDDVVLHVNDYGARALGLPREEIVGKRRHDLFDARDAMRQRDALVEVMTSGKSLLKEDTFTFPFGEIVLDTRLVPVKRDEKVVAVLGISRDATEKRRRSDEVLESEKRYRAIFNAANDAIFVHGGDGAEIFDANEKACAMFGYSHAEFQRLSMPDLSWGDTPYARDDMLALIRSTGSNVPRTVEWLCRNRDGGGFWTEVDLKRSSFDGQSCVLSIVRDISERKRVQEQLHLYSENLERMVEERTRELDRARAELFMSSKLAAMGRLGAGIAHQLNSPICGSLLVLDSLMESAEAGSATAEKLAVLRRTIAGMRDVIDCMLALAMVGKDGSAACADIDINQVIRRIVGFETLECHKRGIRIEARYADAVPSVFAMVGEIDQVILNVMNNAIESMSDGGVLSVESFDDGDWIRVDVRDTGEGILGEDMEKIFEPFYTTKRKQRSLGLGLSIVRETLARHGGTVRVSSAPGQGSVFSLRIPVVGKGAPA